MKTETKMHYIRGSGRQFKRRPGMVVVHNHVMHTKEMFHGMNGFRVWQQVKTNRLAKCGCGWNGVEHFRLRGTSNKCYTWEEIRAAMRAQR